MYLAFLYASKSSMQMYSYTRYFRYACVYVHYMTKYLSFLACKHYIGHILRYPKPRKQRHVDVALALLRGGSAACVASSCHGRYWSALWLGAMAAHLWILLVDWCWLIDPFVWLAWPSQLTWRSFECVGSCEPAGQGIITTGQELAWFAPEDTARPFLACTVLDLGMWIRSERKYPSELGRYCHLSSAMWWLSL